MKYNIRSYKNEDFNILSSWFNEYENTILPKDLMVEDGTFILEMNGVPALSLTVLLTQAKGMAYLFAYIKNPILKGYNMDYFGSILWKYCQDYAKEKGYNKLICFSPDEKLTEKYKRFGMKENLKNLTSFIMELT